MITLACALDGVNGSRVVTQVWVPNRAAAAGLGPAVLAQQVLARLDLQPITMGMVPEEGPDRIGAVGVPVWLWVDEPSPRTFGPISDAETAGGLTVTITARVTSIDWDMGDGTVVHCSGSAARGTPYVDAYDLDESPTCGHVYQKQGAPYTITATSHWEVDWTDSRTSGTIPLDLVATTTRTIGELQAITIE